MKTDIPDGARLPTLVEALFSVAALVVGIGVSIAIYGMDPQIPMLLGVLVASLVAIRCKFRWEHIQDGMVGGITTALPAIIILILVGILIGVWILAGVVPTIIYYGLQILTPTWFLPSALIICAITSVATGTSWGTTGTIGVALMGVGAGLGLPLPIVAGAVLSGAYFGDKMSPLSETTNLASAMAGADLWTHIRHMTYTTGVAFGLTLIIEIGIGLSFASDASSVDRIERILETLRANFVISPLLFIPPVVILFASIRRIPAIPGVAMGVLAGVVCAIVFQGSNYQQIEVSAYGGFEANFGDPDVDDLLNRGGMDSMMFTISLVIVAMMFGGVMERTRQLSVIAEQILKAAKSTGSLVVATALTGIASNLVLCDQYMAIVMGGRTFAGAYRDRGLAPENLSRAVEDSATVTANLVPWNAGGAYQAATLGVATIAYLPFNFFCWLSPLVTMLFGAMGWTIHPLKEDEAAKPRETEGTFGAE